MSVPPSMIYLFTKNSQRSLSIVFKINFMVFKKASVIFFHLQPETEGYLAVVLPKLTENIQDGLRTKEEYGKRNSCKEEHHP